jgi:hypothetical protein
VLDGLRRARPLTRDLVAVLVEEDVSVAGARVKRGEIVGELHAADVVPGPGTSAIARVDGTTVRVLDAEIRVPRVLRKVSRFSEPLAARVGPGEAAEVRRLRRGARHEERRRGGDPAESGFGDAVLASVAGFTVSLLQANAVQAKHATTYPVMFFAGNIAASLPLRLTILLVGCAPTTYAAAFSATGGPGLRVRPGSPMAGVLARVRALSLGMHGSFVFPARQMRCNIGSSFVTRMNLA